LTNIEYDFTAQNDRSDTLSNNSDANYIKKEIQKDIYLPNNADLNTLESYLEDGYLFIECKLINNSPPPKSITTTTSSENFTFQNPLFGQKLNHAYSHDKYCTNPKIYNNSDDTFLGKTNNDKNSKHDVNLNNKSVRFEKINLNPYDNSRRSRQEKRNRSTSAAPDAPAKNFNSGHKSRSVEATSKKSSRISNRSQIKNPIHDGFNCVTKDLLDNVYLTYFFKLPSCSPSDRTTCKIENHTVLKLKIIQERKCKLRKKKKCSGDGYVSTEDSNSASSSTQLTEELKDENFQDQAEHEQRNEGNVYCLNSSSLDSKNKVMLREFSRSCRLPVNLFKFDETGISVSFMNNIWIRVEVPILEFIELSRNLIQNLNISSEDIINSKNHASNSAQNKNRSNNQNHKKFGSLNSKRKS
jgi:hypothetical protein